MTTPRNSDDAPRVRITDQFRSRTGFVYDIKCATARLVLRIDPGQGDDTGGYSIAASSSSNDTLPKVDATGPTRLDALHAVAKRWADRGGPDFPPFDWEAVTAALKAVRAL